MKSFVMKGKPWIYLYYAIIIFIILIRGLFEGDIVNAWLPLLFLLFLGFMYIVNKKTYIKFFDKKIIMNIQKNWYSFKMHELEFDESSIDSIEICKCNINGWIWFLSLGIIYWFVRTNEDYNSLFVCCMAFLITILPLIIWKTLRRKIIIHKKSYDILNENIIGYDNTIKLFLLQYAKEKPIKIIDKENNEEIQEQEIDINSLFKSIKTCNYIEVETPGKSIPKEKQDNKSYYIIGLCFLFVIIFSGTYGYIHKKRLNNNQKIINSLIDYNGNINYQNIHKLDNLRGLNKLQKGIIDNLKNDCNYVKKPDYNFNFSDKKYFLDISEFKDISKINEILENLNNLKEERDNLNNNKYDYCYNLIKDLKKTLQKDTQSKEDFFINLEVFKITNSFTIPFNLRYNSCVDFYQYLLSVQDFIYYDEKGYLNCTDDNVYYNLITLSEKEEQYRLKLLEKAQDIIDY